MSTDELIKVLKQQLEIANKQNSELLIKIDNMQAQLEKLLRQLYGRKSEQLPQDKDKGKDKNKKDDDNSSNQSSGGNTTKNNKSGSKPKDKPKRNKLPDSLARDTIYYDLPEDEKHCKDCGLQKDRIGEEITEQLEFIPASLFVKELVRYKYKCACCIETVSMPAQPIDKGIPGPGLLADVIISKYEDSTPLYRQNQRFMRQNNIDIPESTLCDWVTAGAFWLEPIVIAMKEDLLKSIKIHTDDTTVPVLAKGKTRIGRLWVYLTDGARLDGKYIEQIGISNNSININKCTIYEYTPTRSGIWPFNFLAGFKGFLQADAYAGYDKVFEIEQVVEVACIAHARRHFFDIAKAAKGLSLAHDAIDQIGLLYKVEQQCKNMSAFARCRYRKKHSKPILKELYRWLKKQLKILVPNTPIIKAVNYMLNHWRALCNYLSNGYLDIDNNKGERAMRRVAIGRKNWMFAGSDEGGKRTAIIYSILETCKQNDINPFEYLKDLFTRLPNAKQSDIKSLLPYNWQPV